MTTILESEACGNLVRGQGAQLAISHLRAGVSSGRHWYLALLEAIGFWDLEEEVHNDRYFRFLIDGEAFDWFLLAERLLPEVDGSIPGAEVEALLFLGQAPLQVEEEEMRRLMGYPKYRAHLNYWYGITVEEALILAVEREVRKERRSRSSKEDHDLEEEVYRRIYGQPHSLLLREFCAEHRYSTENGLPFTYLKEFTYWLFKYRLRNSHKVRIASDTRKGMDELQRQRACPLPPGAQGQRKI
ncbi:MAG: hypothetical protein Q8R28_23590 [Dehalococcoidia bacterium]|nr:hypothetical protein [Dehalococcoidia bacterium]